MNVLSEFLTAKAATLLGILSQYGLVSISDIVLWGFLGRRFHSSLNVKCYRSHKWQIGVFRHKLKFQLYLYNGYSTIESNIKIHFIQR